MWRQTPVVVCSLARIAQAGPRIARLSYTGAARPLAGSIVDGGAPAAAPVAGTVDVAAVAFGGAAVLQGGGGLGRQAALFGGFFARADALGGFFVELLRHRGRAAHVAHSAHHHRARHLALAQGHGVAHTHFARGFGDCKDKATLIVTMLKELGINATIVILRTGMKGDFETEPASLAPFDHAIAYVPSMDLYLDGTAEFTGSTELPAMDRGSLAIQVNEGKPKAGQERACWRNCSG